MKKIFLAVMFNCSLVSASEYTASANGFIPANIQVKYKEDLANLNLQIEQARREEIGSDAGKIAIINEYEELLNSFVNKNEFKGLKQKLFILVLNCILENQKTEINETRKILTAMRFLKDIESMQIANKVYIALMSPEGSILLDKIEQMNSQYNIKKLPWSLILYSIFN